MEGGLDMGMMMMEKGYREIWGVLGFGTEWIGAQRFRNPL